jgi:hypothetical protein
MKKSILLWLIAIVLTLLTAAYQRMTGPTYPISGEAVIGGELVKYSLDRSHGGEGDHQININVNDETISGKLFWKRYKTNDEWASVEMKNHDEKLIAFLPHQPPAGKLIYHILLQNDEEQVTLPPAGEVVIRFKGDVPVFILIPHIIFIFGAMLLSTRTGLEYFNKEPKYKNLVLTTYFFLILGGLVFGPITQLYAFGALWTGFPFGYDLTDNKTLIAFIGWTIAVIALFKSQKPVRWIIFAAVLMFIIFLIPHSLLGSELDYSELDRQNNTHFELNTTE